MEKRGRKISNYMEVLIDIIKSDFLDYFIVNGCVDIPKRNDKIYSVLANVLSEQKFSQSPLSIFFWIKRNFDKIIDDSKESLGEYDDYGVNRLV